MSDAPNPTTPPQGDEPVVPDAPAPPEEPDPDAS